MSLEAGRRLGAFEILAPLGAGGMGEVWRARDPKLGREVALKILPEDLARDPERIARFEREARLLAALSHPGIGAIHGFEQADGLRFLVLELVPGETLAERLTRGPLPLRDALRLGAQIAEALEAAHARGVIHRDLKPANIKLTPEGRAKVLDFGLAKESTGAEPSGVDQSPTLTRSPSAAGLIVGTAAYMSPEQARGLPVDRRTDLWSLGCVLFEMLTGRRAFAGATTSDLLAAVLTREPDWEALPGATPPLVRSLVRRCLQKDRERRWHDAGDVRIELEEALVDWDSGSRPAASGAAVASRRGRAKTLGALLALFAAGLGVGAALVRWPTRTREADSIVRHFELAVPGGDVLPDETFEDRALAVSPDGRFLAVTTIPTDNASLHLIDLSSPLAESIIRVDDGWDPFFSPDSAWLGFYVHAERKVKKLPVGGGAIETICEADDMRGGAWGPDGTIVFADLRSGGLMRVSSAGGDPRPMTTPPESGKSLAQRWPSFLPGGKAVVFGAIPRSGREEDGQVAAADLGTGQIKVLVEGAGQPRYAAGHLLFVQRGAVMAAPFDPERLELRGPVRRVLPVNVFTEPKSGIAYYDLSPRGLFAYVPRRATSEDRTIVEADRRGNVRTLTKTRRPYTSPALSPDGRRLAAIVQSGPGGDLWVGDMETDSWTRLTSDGDGAQSLWHPDGRRIVTWSRSTFPRQLRLVHADGSRPVEVLLKHPGLRGAFAFSPNGRFLALVINDPETRNDIWLLGMDGDHELRPWLRTPADERSPEFSPDGRWILYSSYEGGREEIFARAFPGPGVPRTVADGGLPMWPSKSSEVFFFRGASLFAAAATLGDSIEVKAPVLVLDQRMATTFGGNQVSLSADGQRMVFVPQENAAGRALRIVAIPDFRVDLAVGAAPRP